MRLCYVTCHIELHHVLKECLCAVCKYDCSQSKLIACLADDQPSEGRMHQQGKHIVTQDMLGMTHFQHCLVPSTFVTAWHRLRIAHCSQKLEQACRA